jgi:anti-anti-sigma factor
LGIDGGGDGGENRPPRNEAPPALRPNFTTWLVRSRSTVVLRVSGEVDLLTAPWLADAVDASYATGLDVVVDLGNVEFMDCAGLRVLLDAAESRPAHERLTVTQVPLQVQRLLELTGIGRVVRVASEPSAAAA